jgi:hypothetical protein
VVAKDAVIALLILPVIGTDDVIDVPASINELALILLAPFHIVNLPDVPDPTTPPPAAPAVNAYEAVNGVNVIEVAAEDVSA